MRRVRRGCLGLKPGHDEGEESACGVRFKDRTPSFYQRVNACTLPASTLTMLPVDLADLSEAKK